MKDRTVENCYKRYLAMFHVEPIQEMIKVKYQGHPFDAAGNYNKNAWTIWVQTITKERYEDWVKYEMAPNLEVIK